MPLTTQQVKACLKVFLKELFQVLDKLTLARN